MQPLLTACLESGGPSPFLPPLANRSSYEVERQFDRTGHPVQDRAAVAAASVEPKLETLQCFCSLDGLVLPPNPSVDDIMTGLASPRARVGPRARPPRLPSRVIDLSLLDPDRPLEFCRLSLHYTRDADSGIFADYAALSHRWGGEVPFQTTKETLNERTAGFALGELPRSFQDAALVARSLGIRYLWIDSLCIVQDDEGDWLLESRRMGVIFADASVTIAAHSSPNPGHGFLSSALVPDFLRIRPKNPSGRFAIRIPDPANANLLQRFKHSCIMSRAWVVQELSLSPRILHFVEDCVIWECIHCPVEIGGEMPGTLAGELLRGRRGANHYDYWYRLVQQYSRCSMTEPEDKLVALAGIVDQFHNLFPSMLYHDYHCGVFNTDIVRGILWFARPHHAALQRHPGRAPSWSWASVDGPLGFACDITPSIADVSSRITIRSFRPGTAEPIPFEGEHGPGCPLVSESLLIKRKFAVRPRKPKVLAPECYNPGVVGVWTPHGRSDYPADIAWEILDSGAGIEGISSSVRCVVVSRMTSEETYLGSWMLLLTKSKSTPGAYERVGFGCLLDESVLKKARREVITLV